jgi:DNA (cytosine-5)-methyltransferase 1
VSRPVLLDTYSKAGGAAMGYAQAGFDVVCVDIEPQRNNPFEFHQADAVEFIKAHGHEFDVIAGSPVCLRWSKQTKMHGQTVVDSHPDLIGATRDAMTASGRPWVIENVEGAPLVDPLILCGSMWGMERLRRHRLFESSVPLLAPGPCRHEIQRDVVSVTGHAGGTSTRDGAARFGGKALWSELMGIDWMTVRELAQAVPPAYTEFIGRQLMAHLALTAVAS